MTDEFIQRSDAEVIERIEQIITEHVRPYIEMDGGTIEFVRFEESVAYVRLAGACRTCPSSMITLKGGVERAIRRRMPEVHAVEMEDAIDSPVATAFLPITIDN